MAFTLDSWAEGVHYRGLVKPSSVKAIDRPKPLHGDLRFQEHLDGWGSQGPLDQLDASLASNLG